MHTDKEHIISLITGYLTGTLSEREQAELESWLEANEKNRQFFRKLTSGDTFSRKRELYQNISPQKALHTFKTHARKKSIARYGRNIVKYTAAIALVVTAGITVYQYNNTREQITSPPQEITSGSPKAILVTAEGETIKLEANRLPSSQLPAYVQVIDSATQLVYNSPADEELTTKFHELQIPKGGEYKLLLPDSTFVYLNSASRLKFPASFGKDKREVYLSGEAYFEVTKDSHRPFYVITDDVRVKVYGTSFNVNTQDREYTRTVLVEGKIGINVMNDPEETILYPNQLALFDKQKGTISVQKVNTRQYTAWKDGLFLFEDEPLEKIMEKLALWYDVHIFYANDNAREICFTGYLKRYGQIDMILKAIQSTVSVSFEIHDKTITVYERK